MAPETSPIRLKDKAYDDLLRLVLSGELPAGSSISERQLVARFRFSKTPIRVALERLERDGLVEILPQRGVRVRALTDKEIADHFDLRTALESWVATRVAESEDELVWTDVRAALDAQRAAVAGQDVERYAIADADFHDAVAVLAGNDQVVRVMRDQRQRLFRIILRILTSDAGRLQASFAEHLAIVEALERGDAAAATARVHEHLAWGRRFLLSRAGAA